jgi:hypothetical protein
MAKLFWRAGKFIYPRGSHTPIHFMPLQEFSLETALNNSLLVALRMARKEGEDGLLKQYEIAVWRDTVLSEALAQIVARTAVPSANIREIGAGDGLVFEELKLLWPNGSSQNAYQVALVDPQSSAYFYNAHEGDDVPFKLLSDSTVLDDLSEQDTVFVNQLSAIRPAAGGDVHWSTPFTQRAGGVVLALRVSDEVRTMRTTIRGRQVEVPPLSDVLNKMKDSGRSWSYLWLPDHDTGFFLPEMGYPHVGALLGYSRNGASIIPGFKALV